MARPQHPGPVVPRRIETRLLKDPHCRKQTAYPDSEPSDMCALPSRCWLIGEGDRAAISHKTAHVDQFIAWSRYPNPLLTPGLAERIRRPYRRRDLTQAIVDEMLGLQYTMAVVVYNIRERLVAYPDGTPSRLSVLATGRRALADARGERCADLHSLR
jgi:hypothetical protein